MAKLEIRCPICSKWDKIEILDGAVKNVKKGLLAVNITPGMICDHSFIAYVDNNLTVRECFIVDFKIEAPEVEISQKEDDKALPEAEQIRFDLIKLNLPEKSMIFIFNAIFFGKKIIILSEDQFLYNHIINFFRNAMQDLFKFGLLIMSEESYKKVKVKYEDYIVFKKSNIIHGKSKLFQYKKLNVEKSITQKFLAEYEPTTGFIILRNEIQKAYEFSKELAEFISDNQKEIITTKALIDRINEKKKERVKKDYLTFLLNIVKNYFKVEIPKIEGVSDFLGYF
ncbi:MAG: hypothetical protein KGD65_02540 [Candidatus Lokiarchaeota archaeon]|nr:hypothetical protein [Candidatus Lokiarchaeota archaeon]